MILKPFLRVSLIATVLATAGCANGSFLGGNDYPSGDIVLSMPANGSQFSTSAAHPFDVNGNVYSIGITEGNYGGPYTITAVSNSTGFNEPCYVPHIIDATDQTNIVQFRPDNGSSTGGAIEANPCNPTTDDLEVWLIADDKHHSLEFYTFLPANPVTTSNLRSK